MKSLSPVRLFATPWTVAHQAPPSMGFSRQEYWSGLPFPSPGDLPNPGIEPRSPTLQADALTSAPPGKPVGEPVWKLKSRNPGSISFQNVENSIPGPPGMHWPLCTEVTLPCSDSTVTRPPMGRYFSVTGHVLVQSQRFSKYGPGCNF